MRILTGLQSNTKLHIGNYFGAILPMVNVYNKLGEKDELFYFVPNLHSFTMPIDHSLLMVQTLDNIRTLLAAGVDHTDHRVNLFRQSRIPGHTQLSWTLECFTSYGEASRMTQFKDKSLKVGQAGFSVGLLTYPILMAADILLYDIDYIPVGEDQHQHLELCRDIAIRLNNKFGNDLFTIPKNVNDQLKFIDLEKGLRIKSLSNPDKKMSKSDQDPKGTIYINDNADQAFKKIMSATTDSVGIVNYDIENQPGISNLIQIYSCCTNTPLKECITKFTGMDRYGDFKSIVATSVKEFLIQFQKNQNQYSDSDILDILEVHEKRVGIISENKIKKIYDRLGL